MTVKQLEYIQTGVPASVGDGFYIRRPLPSPRYEYTGPFLMLDHFGPTQFPAASAPRGVDAHPHKGFETITVLFEGDLAHRDSMGNQGVLNAGDVQWMTAASGIVHEEKHGPELTLKGGTLHGLQIWLNLPAVFKKNKAGYQDLRASDIPTLPIGQPGSRIRVIAGNYQGTSGAAQTLMPVDLWDVYLERGDQWAPTLRDGHPALLYLVDGQVDTNQGLLREAQLGFLSAAGDSLSIHAMETSHLVILSAAVIEEPVTAYGPFVMNTQDEILEAIREYQSGKMGSL